MKYRIVEKSDRKQEFVYAYRSSVTFTVYPLDKFEGLSLEQVSSFVRTERVIHYGVLISDPHSSFDSEWVTFEELGERDEFLNEVA